MFVHFVVTVMIIMIIIATSSCHAFAQSDQPRPSGLPSDRDVVAFSNRAEGEMLSGLTDARPVMEGYFQRFVPKAKVGYALDMDRYVLGRFRWGNGPTVEDLLNYQSMAGENDVERSASDQRLLEGLLQIMVPDWKQLRPERYEYKFVKRDFLGAVRCLVYDVKALNSEDSGFVGRVYLEDRSWNIVRFTGINSNVDRLFSTLRCENSRFRIDSWRVNVAKNRWAPSYAYVEEVPPLDSPEMPVVKGQIRFWGYDRTDNQQQQQFTDVLLNESSTTVGGRKRQPPSPQQSQRLFEDQAEENVLARLHQARFLGAPGDVEKMLDQVVTNLIVTNKLVLGEPVHCRVLLTTPLEAFTVGNTIVISRGLIDVLPSESAIALVLAHQVAHNILGHRRVDTKLAFADVLRITDAELLAKLRFRHSASEEAAADAKAMEILAQSPYKDKASDGGLFIEALQARVKQLSNLIQPHFGEHVADAKGVVRNNDMLRTTPVFDEELPDQVAALPLGSKLLVNPWNGQIELVRSEPLAALALRERAELAVTPFMPFLDYLAAKSNLPKQPTVAERSTVPKPSNTIMQRPTRPAGSVVTRSVPPVKKRPS
jgi:hypothetical protein